MCVCITHTKRHRGDSNPCGQSPMDFESISLAARTQCLNVRQDGQPILQPYTCHTHACTTHTHTPLGCAGAPGLACTRAPRFPTDNLPRSWPRRPALSHPAGLRAPAHMSNTPCQHLAYVQAHGSIAPAANMCARDIHCACQYCSCAQRHRMDSNPCGQSPMDF